MNHGHITNSRSIYPYINGILISQHNPFIILTLYKGPTYTYTQTTLQKLHTTHNIVLIALLFLFCIDNANPNNYLQKYNTVQNKYEKQTRSELKKVNMGEMSN